MKIPTDARFEQVFEQRLVWEVQFHQRLIAAFPDKKIGEIDEKHLRKNLFEYPPRDWWEEKISLIECQHRFGLDRETISARWLESTNEFLGWFREGDELWTFCSPAETWQRLAGRKGVVLVVEGVSLVHIVTIMN